jgi:hypothetical protein
MPFLPEVVEARRRLVSYYNQRERELEMETYNRVERAEYDYTWGERDPNISWAASVGVVQAAAKRRDRAIRRLMRITIARLERVWCEVVASLPGDEPIDHTKVQVWRYPQYAGEPTNHLIPGVPDPRYHDVLEVDRFEIDPAEWDEYSAAVETAARLLRKFEKNCRV